MRLIDTRYAVGHAKGIFASGRAEDSILSQKMLHFVQHLLWQR